jgi:FkbM family methyltransferase
LGNPETRSGHMRRLMLLAGPGNYLSQCRHGLMLYNANDAYVGRSLDLYGEFSEREVEVFKQLLHPGAVVVELGANIGAHTLCLAQAAAPGGVVHAFEPQRLLFQTLCANMALNGLANAHCYHAAAGAAPGSIVVPVMDFSRPGNFGGLSLGTHTVGEKVPLTTVDALELQSCRLLKIDVEGMELEVLKGAVQMLQRCRPLLYVENDRDENSLVLMGYIDSQGYHMYWHCPPLYNPHNYYENDENVFGHTGSGNLICVPAEANFVISGFERALPGDLLPYKRSNGATV